MQLLCLSLVVVRCQPLRRALAHTSHKPELVSCYGISVQWSFALV
ncbi:C4-dicarboxylate ABC transporter [Vibrio cholerae]|nr:C4-dicarboxylate ABC transporter [Vibrio cholerae]